MKLVPYLAGFACLLSFSFTAQAQRGVVNAQNAGGTFKVPTSSQQVNAKYSLSAAYPDNIVLQITPDQQFTLVAHIIDAKGKEVAKIPNSTVAGRYVNSIDISKLAPGEYSVEMLAPGKSTGYRMPFTVGTQSVYVQPK